MAGRLAAQRVMASSRAQSDQAAGLHGLLLRSLHTGRSRRDFTGAAWSLCARLLAITR